MKILPIAIPGAESRSAAGMRRAQMIEEKWLVLYKIQN